MLNTLTRTVVVILTVVPRTGLLPSTEIHGVSERMVLKVAYP